MEVVILCGGKGTRSYPFTEYFPKPMMPVGGRPILVHLMKLFADQGFRRFVLAVGHRQEVIIDYFADRFREWDVNIVDTGAESDTGERIRRCSSYLGERFFATYGDGLGDINLCELRDFHKQHGGLATLTSVPLRSQYGTVDTDSRQQVTAFNEKPVLHDHWINAGFMVLEKKLFDDWSGSSMESDLLPSMAGKGSLFAYRHYGFWKSMDTSKDQQELERLIVRDQAPWNWGERQTAVA